MCIWPDCDREATRRNLCNRDYSRSKGMGHPDKPWELWSPSRTYSIVSEDGKTCPDCGIHKPFTEFHKDSQKKSGYRTYCKDCQTNRVKNHYKENSERITQYKRDYRKENKEHVNEIQRKLWHKHKEKYRERMRIYRLNNLDKFRENRRKSYRRNPEANARYGQKYRALKRSKFVEHVSMAVLRERDGDSCYVCKELIDFSLKHPDPMSKSLEHVIPISRGGEHSYANTAISHLVCNMRKGNRTI